MKRTTLPLAFLAGLILSTMAHAAPAVVRFRGVPGTLS